MTPRRRSSVGSILLAVVGILVMLAGLGIHWYAEARGAAHKLEWIPQFIGAAIAFAGFYSMDPKRAKDGGGFLIDAGTRIVGAIRPGGRRATDPPVMTPAIDPTPLDADSVPPTGGFEPKEGA